MRFSTRILSRIISPNRHQKILFAASLVLLFWAIFDGLLAYILPLQIIGLGFTASQMGLIIASSNVCGAIFDFLLAKFITNTHYRRLFLIIYGLGFIYPLILWSSKVLPLFLLSMAVWGLYGDLHSFALFDFVSRRAKPNDHTRYFGILGIFASIGYLIAPIIAGLVVTEMINFFPYSLSFSFILISFIFYLILVQLSPRQDSPEYDHTPKYPKYNFIKEFVVLTRISRVLFPVLLFSIIIYIFDGAIWTIVPLFASTINGFTDFGGLLMTAYTLPVLIVNWFIGPITKRYGKKRTAYFAFLFGCLFLIPISFSRQPFLIILFMFLSSMAGTLAWPAIRGAYADYIHESHRYRREIESLNDFTCNIGYIIGPGLSGILADVFGIQNIFLILGSFCIFIVAILFVITPRHIHVVVHRS